MLKLFANHKNDYFLIPAISNREGIIEITKEWINEEIKNTRNLFIMDYSSTLDDCQPMIEIKIMNKNEIEKAINGMKLYKKYLKISDKEIKDLSKADNEKYILVSKVIEFKNQVRILEADLITSEIKK